MENHKKNFISLISGVVGKYSMYDLWKDFLQLAAISISNVCDFRNSATRTQQYADIMKKYTEKEAELFPKLFCEVVNALDANPEQDFLGSLYMEMEFGKKAAGQFFTPYPVCKVMAGFTYNDLEAKLHTDSWITVNDPACGAGGTLIALANEILKHGINYQTSVFFVGQDIDCLVSYMSYIQLSLLGCPGYIVVADTLSAPLTGDSSDPLILPYHKDNIWITPMFFREEWEMRRTASRINRLFEVNKENYYEIQKEPA